MSAIKKVAVVGASGNLGKPLVRALLDAGFNVTALTRESSNSTFPSGVATRKVNYESVDSLKAALQGQDAVVSTTASAAVGKQYPIVDAAVEVGVKRFIPSEFGINTRTLDLPGLKTILQGKVKTLDYIMEKSRENRGFTWTGVTCGNFFDFVLKLGGIGLDKTTKTARLVDSGNEPFSPTTLPFVGKAVAAILANPEKTANKYLAISSFTTTQNALLKIVEEETGEKWTITHVKGSDLENLGNEKLSKGDFGAFPHLIQAYLYSDGGGHALKPGDSANGLLGLEDEDPRVILKAWLDGSL